MIEFDYKKFGHNYMIHRQSLNITRTEVCTKLDIGYSYLSNIENGKNKKPSTKLIVGLVNTVHKGIEDIMSNDDTSKIYRSEIINNIKNFDDVTLNYILSFLEDINKPID